MRMIPPRGRTLKFGVLLSQIRAYFFSGFRPPAIINSIKVPAHAIIIILYI